MPRVLKAPARFSAVGWSNSKSVTVDNTGNNNLLPEYAVRLTVSYEDEMKADFGDVRFVDGTTPLAHFRESYTASTSAVFWVRVPVIPGASTTTVTMYYGNSGVSSASNGDDTFDLFDHFERAPVGMWTRHSGNPIMTGDTDFEDGFFRDAHVLRESASDWKMWYWGNATDLGYATSTDGLAWTRVGEININGARPCVVKRGSTYYLFYNSGFAPNGVISVASSTNPAGPFTGATVILTGTEDWEADFLYVPSVIYDEDDGIWKMWYSASSHTPIGESYTEPAKIGYATCSNAVPTSGWTKYAGNPIIEPTHDYGWQHSAIQGWEVVKIDDTYHCIYTAADYWGAARIGYTTSTSETEWTLSRDQLILDLGVEGAFDQDYVYGSNPVNIDGLLWTYYNARHTVDEVEALGIVYQTGAKVEDHLDTRKWWRSRGAALTVFSDNSLITMDSGEASGYGYDNLIQSHDTFQNCMVEARVRVSADFTGDFTAAALLARSNGVYTNPIGSDPTGAMTHYTHQLLDGSSSADTSNIRKTVNGTGTTLETVSQTVTRGTWYIQGLGVDGSSIRSFVDYTEVDSDTDTEIPDAGVVAWRAVQSVVDADWLRVRKYSYPEPTASAV